MSRPLDEKQTAERLTRAGRILILPHAAPDGDTVGSAFALCAALQRLGKQARILCSDSIPPKYEYLKGMIAPQQFEPDLIVAVDVADRKLLGKKVAPYSERVELCIDHHMSNTGYADELLLGREAAATCEVMVPLLDALGAAIDESIADALYTGIASDTGCFRYANTTPATLRRAARLAASGAHTAAINKRLFETVSLARMKVEAAALQTLQFFHEGRTAVMVVPYDAIQRAGAQDWELEGIASLPSRVEGVLAGVTLKEKRPGVFKISMRTSDPVDAAAVCANLGGGGHKNAAGCEYAGTADEARDRMVALIGGVYGK